MPCQSKSRNSHLRDELIDFLVAELEAAQLEQHSEFSFGQHTVTVGVANGKQLFQVPFILFFLVLRSELHTCTTQMRLAHSQNSYMRGEARL